MHIADYIYGQNTKNNIDTKKESMPMYFLKISYSWGDEEPLIPVDSFEHGWEKAKAMAINELETSCTGHECENGISFDEENRKIAVHYMYDNEYCYYEVIKKDSMEKTEAHSFTVTEGTFEKEYEFTSSDSLMEHLKYWSSATGDLDFEDECMNEDSLPDELKRAFNILWEEGNGCLEYLVEFEGKYYVALVSEFDDFNRGGMNMDEIYAEIKTKALEIHNSELFKHTVLVCGKGTGPENCHEIIFLVPAMEEKSIYDAIESYIYENLC